MKVWDVVRKHYGALMGTNGSAHVITGPAGDASIAVLVADASDPGANDILTDIDGFKSFEAMVAGAIAAGSTDAFTEMVVVAWSYDANDNVGVAALLASAVGELDSTPTVPPIVIPNVRVLRGLDDIVGATWDGTTRIKTIGVRAAGNTPGQVNVLINVVT